MKQKILVTGATGYIGSHLIDKLLQGGSTPVGLLSEKRKDPYPMDVETRIMDAPDFLRDIDIICHLAGMKGVDRCAGNVRDAISANLAFTERLIEKASQQDIRVILVSTYWVYGHRASLPYEEDTVLMPSEAYGWTKALAEKIVVDSGLNYAIARLSNVFGYGTGQGYDEVVSLFLKKALAGGELILQNGGNHSVDLISIDDVCRALLLLLESPRRDIVLNVGGGAPVTIRQIAEAANRVSMKLTGKRAELGESYGKNDDVLFADRWVNISRLRDLTGFAPTPLESSLEYFANQLCCGE